MKVTELLEGRNCGGGPLLGIEVPHPSGCFHQWVVKTDLDQKSATGQNNAATPCLTKSSATRHPTACRLVQ